MGLPAILIFQIWFFWLSDLRAQSLSGYSTTSARTLDSLLQNYAYKAFVHPKTGFPYDGNVPSNLTGIKIAAMRLRNGSLRNRGVKRYKEFVIPTGVFVKPYVRRLALVYQNLGNWSQQYYSLPGYTYLAPVLGLLAYDASEISATQFLELDIQISGNPILINFSSVKSVADVTNARCVWFDLQGSAHLRDLESGNICPVIEQGHFSIVAETIAPPPEAPVAPSPSPDGGGTNPSGRGERNGSASLVWVISSCILGGLLLLGLSAFLVLWVRKNKQRNKILEMERTAAVGEVLHMASVGDAKAPVAMVTRTRPMLETEYVP